MHLKYLRNLARYWLQAVWGWHDSVETCRRVIICEIIVHLLVTVQNNKRCTVQRIEIHFLYLCYIHRESVRNRKASCLYKCAVPTTWQISTSDKFWALSTHNRLGTKLRTPNRWYSSDQRELFAATNTHCVRKVQCLAVSADSTTRTYSCAAVNQFRFNYRPHFQTHFAVSYEATCNCFRGETTGNIRQPYWVHLIVMLVATRCGQ